MVYTTLIDAETLGSRLFDPAFAIVDCRFNLKEPACGEAAYRSRHIPGAVYAHLDDDLSGERTGSNGRHPLPNPSILADAFGRLGIDRNVQVIAYDQDAGMYASRLWWLLRWLGHDAVAVVDGGFAKWISDGRPTVMGSESREPRQFTPVERRDQSVNASEVGAVVGHPGWKLVDARAPERFRGDVEPIDKAAGHIPGAVNHFFRWNLDESGAFLSPHAIRSQFERVLGGVPLDHVVCYCGSGVTACHNLLALEHGGLRGAKLYPGSWSEWSSDTARPIGRGND